MHKLYATAVAAGMVVVAVSTFASPCGGTNQSDPTTSHLRSRRTILDSTDLKLALDDPHPAARKNFVKGFAAAFFSPVVDIWHGISLIKTIHKASKRVRRMSRSSLSLPTVETFCSKLEQRGRSSTAHDIHTGWDVRGGRGRRAALREDMWRQLAEIQQELTTLRNKWHSSNNADEELKNEVASLNRKICGMNDLRQTEELKLKDLQDIIAQNNLKLSEEQSRINSASSELQRKKEKLKRYCNYCKDLLNLDIMTTTDNTVIIEFANLDPADERRKFLCEIKTEGDDSGHQQFKVRRCQPDIGSAKSALEDLMKSEKDLSGFVVALRKQFLKTL